MYYQAIVIAPLNVQKWLHVEQLTICGSRTLYQALFEQGEHAPTLALLSSQKAPASILLAVHDLAQQWRQHGLVIISGFDPCRVPGVGTFYDFQDRLLQRKRQARTHLRRPYRRRDERDQAAAQ